MHTRYPHHHPHIKHFSELKLLFASLSLQSFGFGMVQVFLPLFLINRGIPVTDIVLYFVYWSVIQIFLHDLVRFGIETFGVKHMLAISYVATVASFIVLSLLETTYSTILLGMTLNAIGQSFYWDARHVQSANVIPKKNSWKKYKSDFYISNDRYWSWTINWRCHR